MSNNSKIDLDTLKKLGKLSRIPIDETGSSKLMEDLNKIDIPSKCSINDLKNALLKKRLC